MERATSDEKDQAYKRIVKEASSSLYTYEGVPTIFSSANRRYVKDGAFHGDMVSSVARLDEITDALYDEIRELDGRLDELEDERNQNRKNIKRGLPGTQVSDNSGVVKEPTEPATKRLKTLEDNMRILRGDVKRMMADVNSRLSAFKQNQEDWLKQFHRSADEREGDRPGDLPDNVESSH